VAVTVVGFIVLAIVLLKGHSQTARTRLRRLEE
jgi:hypothetical protein